MSKTALPGPGLQYAVMLKLPSATIQRIRAVQQEFSQQFNFPGAVIKYPHLSLMSWLMDPGFETSVCSRLEDLANKTAPQHVVLSDFEFLTKAFCVKVSNGEALFNSVLSNRPFLRNRLKKESRASKIEFVSHPHITVARRLTDEQLGIIGEKWRPKRFRHDFTAGGFVLLRYPKPGESTLVREFVFSGRPGTSPREISGVQTSLF